MIVDVHAHLDHRQFDKDRDEAIKRAERILIINNGLNPETNRKTLELSSKYKNVKAALGLYPIDALKIKNLDEELDFIRKNKDKIVAVGEVGLDYYWEKQKKKEEKEIFQKIIDLAEEIKKPVIVHSREAELDAIEMLESSKVKAVLHCFGAFELVKRAIDNGFFLSIPANVVFSGHFQKIVEMAELRNLLTETDSPYLSPFRGKRNEPSFVEKGLEKIAKIKNISKEEAEETIWNNFNKIFKK
jgi:TatD DNase family protein